MNKQQIIGAIAKVKYPDKKLNCTHSKGLIFYSFQGGMELFDPYNDPALKWEMLGEMKKRLGMDFEEIGEYIENERCLGDTETQALFRAWLKFKGVEIEE